MSYSLIYNLIDTRSVYNSSHRVVSNKHKSNLNMEILRRKSALRKNASISKNLQVSSNQMGKKAFLLYGEDR